VKLTEIIMEINDLRGFPPSPGLTTLLSLWRDEMAGQVGAASQRLS
jgi:hypothetical protein